MLKIAEHYSKFMMLPRTVRYLPLWILALFLFGHFVMFEKCWEHFHNGSFCVGYLAEEDSIFKAVAKLMGSTNLDLPLEP